MRLPRDCSGTELARASRTFGYSTTRQKDAAVVRQLLPHQPRPVVGDRAVAVVRVRPREALLELTILSRTRAGDHIAGAVLAERLAGFEKLAP